MSTAAYAAASNNETAFPRTPPAKAADQHSPVGGDPLSANSERRRGPYVAIKGAESAPGSPSCYSPPPPLPPPPSFSFPRTDYPDETMPVWPVSNDVMDYAARGAWSARLATREWVTVRARASDCDESGLAETALFSDVVLDTTLDL